MFKLAILLILSIEYAFSMSVKETYAVKYLKNYGYIGNENVEEYTKIDKNVFSESLKIFQNDSGLIETGELDNETMLMMLSLRCGNIKPVEYNEDVFDNLNDMAWKSDEISYCISKYPTYLKEKFVDEELTKAFNYWGQHINLLFYRIEKGCDIEIRFIPFKSEIKGVSERTVSVSMYPNLLGRIFMNDDLQWSIACDQEVNLRMALIHQIGHVLGLDHMGLDSIMSPIYKKSEEITENKMTLSIDDPAYDKIKSIYRPPNVSKNSLCNLNSFDAIFVTANGKYTYIFKGIYYWKVHANDTFIEGYPKLIKHHWPEVNQSINAAYQDENGYTYLIKGEMIWKYFDVYLDAEFPKQTSDVFIHNSGIRYVIQNKTHIYIGTSQNSINYYSRNKKLNNNLEYKSNYYTRFDFDIAYNYPNTDTAVFVKGTKYSTYRIRDMFSNQNYYSVSQMSTKYDMLNDFGCFAKENLNPIK